MDKLSSTWNLWCHKDIDSWKINSFEKLFDINTVKDFWQLTNSWDKLGGVSNRYYFIMRENVKPIWEDKQNINGGCWSFKTTDEYVDELWYDLSMYLVCENISKIPSDIVGLSICQKKNNNIVIKIWNKTSSKNSLKLLNNDILKKWGTDIIYIAHLAN